MEILSHRNVESRIISNIQIDDSCFLPMPGLPNLFTGTSHISGRKVIAGRIYGRKAIAGRIYGGKVIAGNFYFVGEDQKTSR